MSRDFVFKLTLAVIMGLMLGLVIRLIVGGPAAGQTSSDLKVRPVVTQSTLRVEPTNGHPLHDAAGYLQPSVRFEQ